MSFGSPLRYSYICGENEEENPWTPFHVDRGFKREDSTVTVFKASNFCNISGGEGVGPAEILRQIATNMPPMYGGGDGVLLLLGVNHARSLHEAGLTKRDIQKRLWELARLPISHFRRGLRRDRARGRAAAMTGRCGAPAAPRKSTSRSPAARGRRTFTSARACRRPASFAARDAIRGRTPFLVLRNSLAASAMHRTRPKGVRPHLHRRNILITPSVSALDLRTNA